MLLLSIVLALAASLSWGVSDFLGGLTSRRLSLLSVLLVSQSVGLVMVVPAVLLSNQAPVDGPARLSAIAGSLAGLIGIAALYRAIAVGVVSIAAPISATGAVIPVAVGMLRGETASSWQALGAVLAILGVVLAAWTAGEPMPSSGTTGEPMPSSGTAGDPMPSSSSTGEPMYSSGTTGLPMPSSGSTGHPMPSSGSTGQARAGSGFALLAAAGFGCFFVLLHDASTYSVVWATFVQRLTSVGVLAVVSLIVRPSLAVGWRRTPRLLAIGALDQGANLFYGFASTIGLVSLAAVLASLFPVVTVVLARAVLHERLSRAQQTGVACALAGVALIAGG